MIYMGQQQLTCWKCYNALMNVNPNLPKGLVKNDCKCIYGLLNNKEIHELKEYWGGLSARGVEYYACRNCHDQNPQLIDKYMKYEPKGWTRYDLP